MDTYDNLHLSLEKTQDPREQVRTQAEQEIRACKSENTTMFITSLIKVLCDKSVSEEARMMASIIFKNTLLNATQEDGASDIWFSLPPQLKHNIKEALMGSLASENKADVKNNGLCLAIIAAIEVPHGQWPDFLNSMQNNSTNENYLYRLAAVQTLGFMSEQLESFPEAHLSQDQVGQILHSMILNIDPAQVELTRIAIQALQRTMPWTGPNFANDDQRTFIMNGLMKAAGMEDSVCHEIALQALQEVPALGYDYILQLIEPVGSLTAKLMNEQKHIAVKYAFVFWINLCKEEQQRPDLGLNLIRGCLPSLLQLIQQGLEITEFDSSEADLEETFDEISWTVNRASAHFLQELAMMLGNEIWDPVVQWATTKLNSEEWLEQYKGMVALGAVLEGPSSDLIALNMDQVYPSLFTLFDNSDKSKLRWATAWVISQLVKHAPELVFKNHPTNLQMLIQSGITHLTQDHIQIKAFVTSAWAAAFHAMREQPEKSILNQFFESVCQHLLDFMLNEQAILMGQVHNISDAINTCVEDCDSENLKPQLLTIMEAMLSKIGTHCENPNVLLPNCNDEQKEIFLNNFCSTIQILLVRLGNDQITDALFDNIVKLVNFIFYQYQKVTSGGLFIINGLVNCVGGRIQGHIASFIDSIVRNIENHQSTDEMGVRMACGLISDLANELQANMVPYLDKLIKGLMHVLEDQQCDTASKLVAMIAIGDLCLVCEWHFNKYLPDVMKALKSACTASLNAKSNDEEQEKLFTQLRIALTECYISVLHGMNVEQEGVSGSTGIHEHALTMHQYVEAVIQVPNIAFPPELIKNLFELYIDLVQLFVQQDQPQRPSIGGDRSQTAQASLCSYILDSALSTSLNSALGSLNQEDQQEVSQRFYDAANVVNAKKQSLQNQMQQPQHAM